MEMLAVSAAAKARADSDRNTTARPTARGKSRYKVSLMSIPEMPLAILPHF
jgi:hypothetical protein